MSVVFSRHEVPVTSQPITIVHMDDDIVVVNKPASIPVSGLNDRHSINFKNAIKQKHTHFIKKKYLRKY
jgi:23S rRNA-/tRNA-specific pseudouridylate synthase